MEPDPDRGGPGRTRRDRLMSVAGVVLFLAASFLCGREISRQWPQVHRAITGADRGLLALALGVAMIAMVLTAVRWRRCLTVLGVSPPSRLIVAASFFTAELAKYVPGMVWTVVGRGERARRWGTNGSTAYASVALSLAALYGAALLPLGLLLLHPRVVDSSKRVAAKLLRRRVDIRVPSYRQTVRLISGYVVVWVLVGASTVLITRALHAGGSPGRVGLAMVVAWAVGFAAVPVPAGAGIRELVFTGLSGLPAGTAAAVAIVTRLWFIIADGTGAAAGAAVLRSAQAVPRRQST